MQPNISDLDTAEQSPTIPLPTPKPPGRPPAKDMVWIPGGTFTMGSDHHYAEEAPSHAVTVTGFWQEHLADNPSLKSYLSEAIERGYQDGLDLMEKETPLNLKHLPQSCPFSEAEIFDQPVELEE
jgi:hypothetical protein